MAQNILDLDLSHSIKDYDDTINAKHMIGTLYKIINLIVKFGKYIAIIYNPIVNTYQYSLNVKYLKRMIPIIFEFDNDCKYINIVYYNKDQTKTYLKIRLSMIDDPMITYIENDKNSVLPSYSDDKISLKPGEFLIHFCHKLISYLGFNRIRLDDDSHLKTISKTGIEIKTKLWLYSLISKGKSWYEKFGYIQSNCNNTEYQMKIMDMQNIKLDDVVSVLKNIINVQNKKYIENDLLEISQTLCQLIGPSKETLYEYTINHDLEDFTILTNYLTQDIFGRKINIFSTDSLEDNENKYTTIEFPWYNRYKELFIANVLQTNNDVNNSFYKC